MVTKARRQMRHGESRVNLPISLFLTVTANQEEVKLENCHVKNNVIIITS